MAYTDILKGTRADGIHYRIRKIDNMYFYSIQIYSQYEGWHWDTQYRDYSYDKVLQRVAKDNYAVRMKVQKGGCYNGRNSNDFCIRCYLR